MTVQSARIKHLPPVQIPMHKNKMIPIILSPTWYSKIGRNWPREHRISWKNWRSKI